MKGLPTRASKRSADVSTSSSEVVSDRNYCIHCGSQIGERVLFCPNCGGKQERVTLADLASLGLSTKTLESPLLLLERLEKMKKLGLVSDHAYERLKKEYLERARAK